MLAGSRELVRASSCRSCQSESPPRLFSLGAKLQINNIHISARDSVNFCRCSKFLYDVIKANPKWLRPPESQLEDKRQKFAGRNRFQPEV